MKRFLIAFLIIFLLPSYAIAESVPLLRLEQAIEAAIQHNPKLKAAQAKLGISDAELITAGTRLNPAIVSDNGIAEKTYRLGVEQTIELGGKRKQRVALSKAQREVVLTEISTQLLDIRNDVRKAYVELYNAQERQKTYQNILTITQELVSIAQKREKAGDISKLDVLQTEIVNVSTNNDLQTGVIALQQARNRLSALMIQTITTDTILTSPDLSPSFPVKAAKQQQAGITLQAGVQQKEMDLERLIEEAFKNRPEIQQGLRSIEVAKAQQSLAVANRIPNLTLTIGPDFVAEPGQKELNAFIIGNMEIPLFNRQQGPMAEAKARQTQFDQELQVLKNTVRLEVSNAYSSYILNQERLQRYEDQLLPYSTDVVTKSKRAFEEGKTSILTPINAQQAFISTQLAYLQALLDYQNAISDLERAVGAGL